MNFKTAAVMCVTASAATAGTLDDRMAREGMVSVAEECPDVVISLMYARDDNFTGVLLYDSMETAWLHPEAARALARASKALKAERPDLRLMVKDAARPMSTQRKMYRVVRGTSKARYVSNPANGGGLHNYGMAVDITIVDSLGHELPMGTPVDHLGPEANIDREEELVNRRIITADERANRLLLRRAMRAGGFRPLRTEWWHFNLCTRSEARRRYCLLDF